MRVNITTKLLVVIVAITCLGVAVGLYSGNRTGSQLEKMQIEARVQHLQQQVNEQISKKKDVGLTNAIGFAANQELQQALRDGDREKARTLVASVSNLYKQNSDFKNIQLHLHTPELKTFLRSWNDKAGDDLSRFRHSVKHVSESRKGGQVLNWARWA